MTRRATILALIATLLAIAYLNLWAFAEFDSYMSRIVAQRIAASHTMQIKKVVYQCFPVRRTK